MLVRCLSMSPVYPKPRAMEAQSAPKLSNIESVIDLRMSVMTHLLSKLQLPEPLWRFFTHELGDWMT